MVRFDRQFIMSPRAESHTPEWFTFLHKEKYCGEVYLELTYYSNVCVKPPNLRSELKLTNPFLFPNTGTPTREESSEKAY